MFEHLVVFKFKESISQDAEKNLLRMLLDFKGKKIPGIVDLSAGLNVTGEVENRHGYSLGLRVTFENMEALQEYGPHPVHQEFVSALDGLLDNVVVVDYPMGE